MQITAINLACEPLRWQQAVRQFDAVGLRAVRLEAVSGLDLSAIETATLYSHRLNGEQYHKPLRPGEIGCYASHLAAWRQLLASGASAMAVFEDDIEIDADLPQVLAALDRTPVPWDVVKLIGRKPPAVSARRPLCGQRELVAFRRVPSLTGAYVISAQGAHKLLGRRQPFGRPVDVDMRYWWECDLQVLGVLPYPVRGAPCSQVSSIVGRRDGASSTACRMKKLQLQARYTLLNWLANRERPPLLAPSRTSRASAGLRAGMARLASDDAQGDTVPFDSVAEPGPAVAAGAASPGDHVTRRPNRRNLVIVRAGDSSLHPGWLRGSSRDFDIFISYYGKSPNRYRHDGDHYEMRPGPKWPCIADLLQDHAALIARYEAVWFPDDDLAVDGAVIDRMFAFFCAYGLCLAQPALTRNSYYTWRTLLQDPRCHIRYTRFVEVMAPLFSRAALQACAPTFGESRSGWGLDWVWPALCRKAGLGRIAILDATPVHHTRPVGGDLYKNHPDMDPRADAARILGAYGIQEVRAVAKYSFEGQVRDVALPLGERLLFWLKRLNGRRKHRAPA